MLAELSFLGQVDFTLFSVCDLQYIFFWILTVGFMIAVDSVHSSLNRIHTGYFSTKGFFLSQMFIHYLTFLWNLYKCGHFLAFSIRLCIVRKPLCKILLWAKHFCSKGNIREEKEKKKTLLHSHSRIAFYWIFCLITSLMNKSKTKLEGRGTF